MTKKDFELIATVLKAADTAVNSCNDGAYDRGGQVAVEIITKAMANALKETNPRFDIERFIKACKAD